MAILENKYIPLFDSIMYSIDIMPKKIDPYGRIRTPEEIKKGTKEFVHSIYIDRLTNVYIIPMKYENGLWVEYYSHEDIIKAALGDVKSKELIEAARIEIKQIFNKDIHNDVFFQRLYDKEKDSILTDINKHRQEDEEPLLTFAMPVSPKTVNNFSPQELTRVMLIALNS